MSKSYTFKVTKVEKKLVETELLVLSLPKLKAQLLTARAAISSTIPHLTAYPLLPANLWLRIKMMMMRKMKKVLDPHIPPPTKKKMMMMPLKVRKKSMMRSD